MIQGRETRHYQERSGRNPAFVTVQPPAAHQGIGQALRKTYEAQHGSLPQDMLSLLDRLDRY